MEQQKDLDARVGEYYVRPDCGNVGGYAKAEGYKRGYSGDLMGMDLIDFFRQNSQIYDEANRHTMQQVRKVLLHMYVGDFRRAPEGIKTVGDLYKFTDKQLHSCAYDSCVGFGAKTLGTINETLGKAGLPAIPKSNHPYYNRTLYSKPVSVSAKAPSLK